MSQTVVQIIPSPVVKTITQARIFLAQLEFGKSAIFSIDSFTDTGELFKRDSVLMAGEDYQKWLNDDAYAIKFVLAQLGYVAE